MFGFDWPLLVGGVLAAAILLLLGMALGLVVGHRSTTSLLEGRREMHQARLIASRLQHLTNDVSSIVDGHRAQIDQAIQQLATTRHRDHESLAKLVVDVFGNIVNANKSLQSSLTSAEGRLQEQAEEIEAHMSLSMTDPLTGLLNRRGFDEQLRARLAARRRDGEAFSVLMLDVDHFKQINDTYGHLVGDRMLVAVAQALREALRQEDSVARYGGDEFAILLPHTSLDEGAVVAHKLNARIAAAVIEERGYLLTASLSGGLAMSASAEEGKSLLTRADEALYAAKEAGRNCAFMHNGVETCPIPGLAPANELPEPLPAHVPSEAIIEAELDAFAAAKRGSVRELVAAPVAVAEQSTDTFDDPISPQLDDLCDELRRYLAERQQQGDSPGRPKPSF